MPCCRATCLSDRTGAVIYSLTFFLLWLSCHATAGHFIDVPRSRIVFLTVLWVIAVCFLLLSLALPGRRP